MSPRPYVRTSALFAAVAVLAFLPAPLVAGVAGQSGAEVIEASFAPSIDQSGWWWAAQPGVLGGPVPSPQADSTLPVSMVGGDRQRMTSLEFGLAARGLGPYSAVIGAELRITEGSEELDQPPIRPEIAEVSACRVLTAWGPGSAQPMEQAPSFDETTCVSGSRDASGAWLFDLTDIAGPWADEPLNNHGVVLIGSGSGSWQVNLARDSASLTLEYEPPPPPGDGYPAPGDKTGVTAEKIRIGLHAPLSGSVPFNAGSFMDGVSAYWSKGRQGAPIRIHGRTVQVEFRDDQGSGARARTVCRDLVEDGVFLIVGFSGAEQVAACADATAREGVPYLALGTTEEPLLPYRNHFALTPTFRQQAAALAEVIRARFTEDASRVAIVATDLGVFDDAVAGFVDAFPGVTVIRPGRATRGSSVAADLCTGPSPRFDVVNVLSSPVFFLELESAAACGPQYVGVGMAHAFDAVADAACSSAAGSIQGARFFHPTPARADASQFDGNFEDVAGSQADDVEWMLWGLARAVRPLLAAPGETLNRRRFVNAAEAFSGRTRIFPEVAFSRSDHFGGRQVHLLRAACGGSGGRFLTDTAFLDV